MMKSIWPNIDPWRSPWVLGLAVGELLISDTYCLLGDKCERILLRAAQRTQHINSILIIEGNIQWNLWPNFFISNTVHYIIIFQTLSLRFFKLSQEKLVFWKQCICSAQEEFLWEFQMEESVLNVHTDNLFQAVIFTKESTQSKDPH